MKKIITIMLGVTFSSYAGGGVKYATSSPILVTPIKQVSNGSFYAGAGFSLIATAPNIDYFNNKKIFQDKTASALLIAGYLYNPYLSIELRFSKTLGKEFFLKHTVYGIYIKPQYEIYNNLKIYGLLGYGKLKITQYNNSGVNFSDTNLHFGAGLSYKITNHIELFADYVNYSRDKKVVNYFLGKTKKVDTSSINLGFNYHF